MMKNLGIFAISILLILLIVLIYFITKRCGACF